MHTHTPSVVRATAALAMVAFLACGEPEAAADHMEQHFEQVDAVMTAVIAGDLAAVKRPAGWLASHEPADDLPGDWEPFVTDMQAAAKTAEEATDISTVAVATGEMALSCGACHAAVGQGTAFAFMPQTEETGVTGHMMRHSWALDQLWRGLVGPSDESWQQGAQGLDESPIQGGSEETRTLGLRVHELGAQAAEAADPAARAVVYGELLSTCAGCHVAAGSGPPSRPQATGGH
jgi:cytochrome c553